MDARYLARRDFGGRTWGYVIQMAFNARLIVGPEERCGYYDDCWCYASADEAIAALAAWDPETEEEPSGWIKHPNSGRYRPFGDRTREFHADDPPPHPPLR